MYIDRQAIRSLLSPFDGMVPVPEAESIELYRAFYGLDFENRRAGLRSTMGLLRACGYDIVVQGFVPENAKGTILVMHGYYGHLGIYDHLIEHLLELNYGVLGFDLPGHGLSSGAIASISSFHQYQTVLQSVLKVCLSDFTGPLHVVAQSTGGAIIIDYLLSRAFEPEVCPFDRKILLAPLIRPVNWRRNKAVYEVVSPFFDYVTRKFALNSHDQEFLSFLKKLDPLQSKKLSINWVGALKRWIPDVEKRPPSDLSPTIIQGQKDGTVDWRHNVRILKKKFNHPEVIYIPSARHQLVNESPKYRNLVFDHIADTLG